MRQNLLKTRYQTSVSVFPLNVFVFLRTYCELDIDPAHRKYTQLQAAVRYLNGKEPDLECECVRLTTGRDTWSQRSYQFCEWPLCDLCLLPRWWGVAAANPVWRRGNSSARSLLERSDAQRRWWVLIFTTSTHLECVNIHISHCRSSTKVFFCGQNILTHNGPKSM